MGFTPREILLTGFTDNQKNGKFPFPFAGDIFSHARNAAANRLSWQACILKRIILTKRAAKILHTHPDQHNHEQ